MFTTTKDLEERRTNLIVSRSWCDEDTYPSDAELVKTIDNMVTIIDALIIANKFTSSHYYADELQTNIGLGDHLLGK